MVKVLKNKTQKKQDSWQGSKAQQVITHLRHQSEEEEASELAAKLNLTYIDTNLIPISNEDIKNITEEDSIKFNLAVIKKENGQVTLASPDPTRPETAEFIKKLKKENNWIIKTFVISKYNLKKIQEKYKKLVFVDVLSQMSVNLTEEDLQKFSEYFKDLVSLKEKIGKLSTTEILSIIMGSGYNLDASDIHIEPQEKDIRLRYRIDGVLHDVLFLPLTSFHSILSRIKMMGGMKINIRDIAQDGSFEIKLKEKKISVRVSIIPGNFGESIVMRLLDPSSVQVSLEDLGIQGLAYEELKKKDSSS